MEGANGAIIWIFVLCLSVDGFPCNGAITTMVYAQMFNDKKWNPVLCREKPKSITETERDCCPMPDLFTVESIAGCGINFEEPNDFPSLRGSADCAQRTCLLRQHDLLFDNDDIDNESVKQYLEEWVANRREYLPAVNAAKDWCLGSKPLFGIPQMCAVDKLLFCVNSNFYEKCPHWNSSDGCTALRSFLEDCFPYFT